MKTTATIQSAYASVRELNDIAGNLTNVTDDSIDAQLSFCFEELSEAIEAFEKGDRPEILKESCDLFVVVAGLLQKLEAYGYDVSTALARVNENNLSKFPKTMSLSNLKAATAAGYSIEYNGTYDRYVLKDATSKFRKPADYVSADVADLIPNRKEVA